MYSGTAGQASSLPYGSGPFFTILRDLMGGACNTREIRNAYKALRKPERRNRLGDIDVSVRIILKCILNMCGFFNLAVINSE
jgi:hypothetical protein